MPEGTTEGEVLQVAGDITPAPAAPEPEAAELVDNDYGAILASAYKPAKEPVDETPVADTAVEEAPVAPPGDEAASGRTVTEWATILSDAPQRISEVAPPQRAAAITAMRDAERAKAGEIQRQLNEAQRSVAQAKADGFKLAEARTALAAEVANVDAVRESDPAEFAAWAKEFPDRFGQYLAAQRELASPPDISVPVVDPAIAVRERIVASAGNQVAKLRDYPEALALISEKYAAGFMPTDEALSVLMDDVSNALVDARVAAAKPNPVAVAAAERQANATELREKPKPTVPGGTTVPEGAIESINDPNALLSMGFARAAARAR